MKRTRILTLKSLTVLPSGISVSEEEIAERASMPFDEFAMWSSCHYELWRRYR